ncbi:unnamed protein product [Acanthoscelides obtectus]|uniref:Phospholipase A2-like domain-containing protein n=1 Tax=Acanthoscelides obtectus TaxID=200917 RepID=A0A9P0PQZ8_ACAOB|nr:unnamed protein product [Acanthoscelides obtectus]CAK1632197.1 hypothetical protein AOBTE_LOCUS7401 [Acanthoscelides obtectus]
MLAFKRDGGGGVRGGEGVLNSLIDRLPIELHLPQFQYCGPWTHLQKQLRRGDPGINGLDAACKQHDIAYSKSSSIADRHRADEILEQQAWNRFWVVLESEVERRKFW